MKILHLCDQNWVGMASNFVAAHRRAGHEARLVTLARCMNEFEEDISLELPLLRGTPWHMALKNAMSKLHGGRAKFAREPGSGVPVWTPRSSLERAFFTFREETLWKPKIERAIREHALDTFDLYHLESGVEFYRDARFLKRMKARGAGIVCYYLGTDLRERGVIPAVRDVSDLNLTCEWDHLKLDPTLEWFFIPFDVSAYEFREPPADVLRIAHAPRNRAIKNTEVILAAVERARRRAPMEIDLIEGVSHAEAIRRKRGANLLIDQVGDQGATGYGMNSLEAFAMGIPSMTSMEPEYARFLGEHPFLLARPETLEDQLVELAKNPVRLREHARRGREWVLRVHGADQVAQKLYARYRELGWVDAAGEWIPSTRRAA